MLSLQEYAEAINKQDIEIGGNTFKHLSVLTENLPLELQEKGDLVIPILTDLNVFYGITKDNILIFSTYSKLAENFQKNVVSENIIYKKLSQKIDKKGQGVVYFSPKNFAEHLEKLILVVKDFIPFSVTKQKDAKSFIDYLKLLDGFISTNSVNETNFKIQGYLKINH